MKKRITKPSHVDTNPEMRRLWMSCLRKFKLGLKVRAKLGVLDSYCIQVGRLRASGVYGRPNWDDKRWLKLLADCIKTQNFPADLLLGFAETAEYTLLSSKDTPSVDKLLHAAEEVLWQNSFLLRKYFGVFDATKEDKAEYQ